MVNYCITEQALLTNELIVLALFHMWRQLFRPDSQLHQFI